MHSERFEDVVGVLVDDALCALAERRDRAVVPPLPQVAVLVVLTTCAYNQSLITSSRITLPPANNIGAMTTVLTIRRKIIATVLCCRLPTGLRTLTPRLYDWSVSSEHLGFNF